MDSYVFNNIVKDQLEKSEATLIKKAAEYASEGDRLHNFKLAALLQEISTKQALSGMMTKHTVSVYDIIKSEGPVPSQAYIDEKVGDLINYLLLLKAVLHELRPDDDPERTLFHEEPLAEWEKELIRPSVKPGWYERDGVRIYAVDTDWLKTYADGAAGWVYSADQTSAVGAPEEPSTRLGYYVKIDNGIRMKRYAATVDQAEILTLNGFAYSVASNLRDGGRYRHEQDGSTVYAASIDQATDLLSRGYVLDQN